MTTTTAPSPCCPAGSLPAMEFDYEPKGEHFELPAVPSKDCPCKVYLTGASQSDDSWNKKTPVVIMLCDIMGPFSGTHRKLADELASQTNGIVLLPDPFEGSGGLVPQYRDEDNKPLQLGFNRFTWNQFALLGFCYGSWMILKACNDPGIVNHVTCGIHFHPSAELMKKTNGQDDIELCKTCQKPQLLHATKNESNNWKPNGAAHKALEENPNVPEVQFSLAPNTQSHGFMTRADVRVEENRKAVKEGVDLAVAFLKKHNNS